MARYTNEMRERAVRMVAEVRSEHPHETAALRHVAGLLGMNVGGHEKLPGDGHEAARWRT